MRVRKVLLISAMSIEISDWPSNRRRELDGIQLGVQKVVTLSRVIDTTVASHAQSFDIWELMLVTNLSVSVAVSKVRVAIDAYASIVGLLGTEISDIAASIIIPADCAVIGGAGVV